MRWLICLNFLYMSGQQCCIQSPTLSTTPSRYWRTGYRWNGKANCWNERVSSLQYWGEGANWIPIDLNANILARIIYFLQIEESFTHSAFVFNVSSIKWEEKKNSTSCCILRRKGIPRRCTVYGFPKIFTKKYMILKFIRKSTWKQ